MQECEGLREEKQSPCSRQRRNRFIPIRSCPSVNLEPPRALHPQTCHYLSGTLPTATCLGKSYSHKGWLPTHSKYVRLPICHDPQFRDHTDFATVTEEFASFCSKLRFVHVCFCSHCCSKLSLWWMKRDRLFSEGSEIFRLLNCLGKILLSFRCLQQEQGRFMTD